MAGKGAAKKPEGYEELIKWYDAKIASFTKQKEDLILKHAAETKQKAMIDTLKAKGFTDEEIAGFKKLG